jgi:hypothetical protein
LFTGSNSGDQKVNFALQKALNLTYAHLQFKNVSRGLYPQTPVRRGKGREKRELREGLGGKSKEIEGRGWGEGGVWARGEGKGREEKGKGMHRSSPFHKSWIYAAE